jgi:hypothetical protein
MERLGLGDALLTVSALIVALVVRAGARHDGHVEAHLDELGRALLPAATFETSALAGGAISSETSVLDAMFEFAIDASGRRKDCFWATRKARFGP